MHNMRQLIAAAVAGSLLTAGGGALAQTELIVGISTVTTYSADVRIIAVDRIGRTATFAFANGTVTTSSFAGLNTRKVGDTVSVAFEDSLTLVLPSPDGGMPRDRDAVAGSVGKGTADPSTDREADTWWLANWYVVAVDATAGKISVVHPIGGQVLVYRVTTAEGRKHLPRVKTGDYLTAMDPRVQVVSFAP